MPSKAFLKEGQLKKDAEEAIFQWTFESSRAVAGQRALYTTLLRKNGDLTCNCLGWTMYTSKKTKEKEKAKTKSPVPPPRSCKHTKMVYDESRQILKDYHTGKALPEMTLVGGTNSVNMAALPSKAPTGVKFGRRVILD